jgi:GNAT superfamily N-acetyltransferase
MIYRTAYSNEADKIAQLHTQSWQKAYRQILSDDYLDNHLAADRLAVWRARFANPPTNQQVFVAEEAGILIGFVCLYKNDDPKWGSLIDNLHVLSAYQGKGVGNRLMDLAAEWVKTHSAVPHYYLWVYAANTAARLFYEKIGGQNVESEEHDNPDGSRALIMRYVW